VIAYLDSSVFLRLVLGQKDQLAEWPTLTAGVTSALTQVECLRTLDRLRLQRTLPEAVIESRQETVLHLLRSVEIVEITPAILYRATQPMPAVLGTLDAIHVATALLWSELTKTRLVLATHDRGMARAASASGFTVFGVASP
jgi:predicted nucleic acid-binding protein